MELKDATLAAATPLSMVDNDHKTLLEWSVTIFKCGMFFHYSIVGSVSVSILKLPLI